MNVKTEILEVYCYVMENLNVTKAAKVLGMSQPSASKMLNQLEISTGFKLFYKVRGRLKPTKEGEQFYRQAAQTLMSLRKLEIYAKRIKQNENTKLVISVMPAMCNGTLVKEIAKYKEVAPSITIQLNLLSSESVIDAVEKGTSDIGIAMNVKNTLCTEIHTIEKSKVAIIPKNHPLANRKIISCNELSNYDMVYIGTKTGQDIYNDQIFSFFQTPPILSYETSAYSTGCYFVSQGLAYAIIDPFTAESNKQLGYNIVKLEEHIPFNFSIISPKLCSLEQHSVNFINQLIRVLSQTQIRPL